jgi:hypothetical protein
MQLSESPASPLLTYDQLWLKKLVVCLVMATHDGCYRDMNIKIPLRPCDTYKSTICD